MLDIFIDLKYMHDVYQLSSDDTSAKLSRLKPAQLNG
jgi:hypothetical protein